MKVFVEKYLSVEMRESNIYRKDLGREGSSANYTLNKTTEEEEKLKHDFYW